MRYTGLSMLVAFPPTWIQKLEHVVGDIVDKMVENFSVDLNYFVFLYNHIHDAHLNLEFCAISRIAQRPDFICLSPKVS
jgi:hypothetical protein